MKDAEGSLDKYNADISERKRIAGVEKSKQRKAVELAQMAIEAAVGDKLEKIIREKL